MAVSRYPTGSTRRNARPAVPDFPGKGQGKRPAFPANDVMPKHVSKALSKVLRKVRPVPFVVDEAVDYLHQSLEQRIDDAGAVLPRSVAFPSEYWVRQNCNPCPAPTGGTTWYRFGVASSCCSGQIDVNQLPFWEANFNPFAPGTASGNSIRGIHHDYGVFPGSSQTRHSYRTVEIVARRVGAPNPSPIGRTSLMPGPSHGPFIAPATWPIARPITRPGLAPRPLPKQVPGVSEEPSEEDDPERAPQRNPRRRTRNPRLPGVRVPLLPFPVITIPDLAVTPGVRPVPDDIVLSPAPGGGTNIQNRPGTYSNRPPRKGTQSKKYTVSQVAGWALVNLTTEGMDAVGDIHKAIPEELRTPFAREHQKYVDIYENFDQIDIGQAIENMINTQIEDMIWAYGSNASKSVSQNLGIATGVDRAIAQGEKRLSSEEVNRGLLAPQVDYDPATGSLGIDFPALGGGLHYDPRTRRHRWRKLEE